MTHADYIIKIGEYVKPKHLLDVAIPEITSPESGEGFSEESENQQEIIEQETARILSEANHSARVGGCVGDYCDLGNIWIGNNFIAGASQNPSNNDWVQVVKTDGGHFLVYSAFRDNPWTDSSSNGPGVAYIDGVSVSDISNVGYELRNILAGDVEVKQIWNSSNYGYSIKGTIYTFQSPSFAIGRAWK